MSKHCQHFKYCKYKQNTCTGAAYYKCSHLIPVRKQFSDIESRIAADEVRDKYNMHNGFDNRTLKPIIEMG